VTGGIRVAFGNGTGGLSGSADWTGLSDAVQCFHATFNGGVSEGFVNGVSIGAPVVASGSIPSALYASTAPVLIGANLAAGVAGSFLGAPIGSAKIYNTVLTADEVLTNFNSQRSLYGAWGKYLATVNSFYESTQTIDQSSYIETNVGARWEIVTDASSIDVESFTSLIQARNAIAKIGYRINGGAWASFGPSTQDTSSIETIALPAGSNAVEFINGIQTTEGTSNVDGTWVQSVSPSPGTTSFTSVVATNLANQLVIYGDSITAGGNATNLPYEGYPIVLRDAISNPVTVEAWGYRTLYEDCNTAGLIDTFVAKLAAVSPTSIWLAIGTNDYALNKQSAANFETMYAALLADLVVALPSTKIYCASPVHRTSEVANTFGDTTGDYRTAISNAVTTTADADVTYVDTSAWLVDGDLDDGVHPTTAGHAIMASQIQTALGL
jgi:lysophospholipase L1-like esterase